MSLTKLHHFFCHTCTAFLVSGLFLSGCSQSETSDSAYANLDTLDVSIGYWNIEDMSNIQKDAMRDYWWFHLLSLAFRRQPYPQCIPGKYS